MYLTGAGGAIPRNAFAQMDQHAELYYEEIRKRTSDVSAIVKNTKFSEEDIVKIKNHIFFNEYDFGEDVPTKFDPSYDMAVSWQRLIEGTNIQEMDLIMLRHELMEHQLMNDQGLAYHEAHEKTNMLYNYEKYTVELDRKEGLR